MRFTKNLIPLSVVLALGAGVACNKPAPAPAETKPAAASGPTEQEMAAQKAAAEEAAKRKAEADAEAARKAAAAAEAEKAAAASYQKATEAALKDINFEFDKSDIRDADKPKLQAIADYLKAFPQAKVQIQGNCDERGTVEYNLALGERRAHAAQEYLVTLGVSVDRLSTISFGKEKPKVEGHDDASWLINRRDEFKLQ